MEEREKEVRVTVANIRLHAMSERRQKRGHGGEQASERGEIIQQAIDGAPFPASREAALPSPAVDKTKGFKALSIMTTCRNALLFQESRRDGPLLGRRDRNTSTNYQARSCCHRRESVRGRKTERISKCRPNY